MADQKITTLEVSGMHCASCALLIERSLKKVPGVEEANVNYSTGKARIKSDSSQVNDSTLQSAVKSAGYSAIVPDAQHQVSEAQKRCH